MTFLASSCPCDWQLGVLKVRGPRSEPILTHTTFEQGGLVDSRSTDAMTVPATTCERGNAAAKAASMTEEISDSEELYYDSQSAHAPSMISVVLSASELPRSPFSERVADQSSRAAAKTCAKPIDDARFSELHHEEARSSVQALTIERLVAKLADADARAAKLDSNAREAAVAHKRKVSQLRSSMDEKDKCIFELQSALKAAQHVRCRSRSPLKASHLHAKVKEPARPPVPIQARHACSSPLGFIFIILVFAYRWRRFLPCKSSMPCFMLNTKSSKLSFDRRLLA